MTNIKIVHMHLAGKESLTARQFQAGRVDGPSACCHAPHRVFVNVRLTFYPPPIHVKYMA